MRLMMKLSRKSAIKMLIQEKIGGIQLYKTVHEIKLKGERPIVILSHRMENGSKML
jgi:hypothetical protein